MNSEFAKLIDERSSTRFVFPAGDLEDRRTHAVSWRSRAGTGGTSGVAVDETAMTPYPAGGAAVGEEQFADQGRRDSVRREMVALEAAFYDDYGTRLDGPSRAGLERFMRYAPLVTQPMVGAESTGRLIATWERGGDCLTLRFVDRFRFHFAIATATAGRVDRRWGDAHALTFFDEHPEARRLVTD